MDFKSAASTYFRHPGNDLRLNSVPKVSPPWQLLHQSQ